MARSRNIKPGFFTNEDLVELDFATRLLFAGLWTIADREGRLQDRPKKIKIDVFPSDNLDIDLMLQSLHEKRFITRYEVDGARYIQITNWCKHQNPHHTEKPSVIPSINGEITVKQPLKSGDSRKQDGENLADSLIPDSLIPDSLIHVPAGTIPLQAEKIISPEPKKKKQQKPELFSQEFENAWAEYPKRPGQSKVEAWKAWKARLLAGASAEVMTDGIKRYAAYISACETEPQFVKHAATFLGPDMHYLNDWSPPKAKVASPSVLGKTGQATAANALRWLEKVEQQEANNASH